MFFSHLEPAEYWTGIYPFIRLKSGVLIRHELLAVFGRSINLGFVTVHHFVARGFDPFIDLLDSGSALGVKSVPTHDFSERLLPALTYRKALREGQST